MAFHPAIHLGIRRQQIALERGHRQIAGQVGTRRKRQAAPGGARAGRNGPGQRAQRGRDANPPHRRGKGGGLHRKPVHQRAQPDGAAHRMRQQKQRLRQLQRRQCRPDSPQIALIIGEPRDMPHHRHHGQPVRQALATPVHRQTGIAATPKVGGSAAIFFDAFRAAGQDQDRSLAALRPDRNPQPHPILGPQPKRMPPFRAIGQVGKEGGVGCHDLRTAPNRVSSQAPSIRPRSASRS